ncbi:MAG: hypothetical protein ABIJ37_06450 [Pseudomonadota bacterium]
MARKPLDLAPRLLASAKGSQTQATVAWLNTVSVKSRVYGQTMRVYFDERKNIEKGKLLDEIDLRPFYTQLSKTKRKLNMQVT